MANFIDNLRSFGANVMDGAARAVASFAARQEKYRAEYHRGHAAARGARSPGERMMASMMRGSGGYAWPGAWTQNRNGQIANYRLWTYIAVSRICHKIASLPPRIALVHADGQGGGGRAQHGHDRDPYHKMLYRKKRFEKSLHVIKPHEEVEDVGADHPIMRLVNRPNAWDKSLGQFLYELVMFLELTGNGYIWVVPNKLGMPLEMWVLPSQWVRPRLGAGGVMVYELYPFAGGTGVMKLPPDEVIEIQYKNPRTKLDGLSPLSATSEWIDSCRSIFQALFWSFENGCFANGAIELDPAKFDPDDKDLDNYVAQLYSRYQGVVNTGRPVVLPPGATYNPLTIAPDEMAFAETSEMMRDNILAAHGVPKEIAGIQDAGSEIAMYGPLTQFCEHAIKPKLQLIGEVLTAALCVRYDEHLRWWWDDPKPDNPEQINKDIQIDQSIGAITINQVCAIRGREPFDNPLADEPLVNPQLVPLSMLQKQLEQQQQQAQQMPAPPAPGQEVEEEPAPAPEEAQDGGAGAGDLSEEEVTAAGGSFMDDLMDEWQSENAFGGGKRFSVPAGSVNGNGRHH